jgi:hypothetical protein
MLIRDAQEESRIVYNARRNLPREGSELLLSHISEAVDLLRSLQEAEKSAWDQVSSSKERTVGLLLLVALGVANETKVDSLVALKSVLLEESP